MLFEEQVARKPNLYPWTQDLINSMWASHWTPNEFNFQSDLQDFRTELTAQEQEIVKRTLSAIGQIEVAVKKFWAKLGDNLPNPSLFDLGYVMASIETTHNIAYEKLLSTLGLEDVFEENLKLDIIKGRVAYLKKYLHKYYADSKKQYIYALILFTLFIENVSLFSQFYIILHIGRFRNLLKDTNQQVLYTKSEELIHAQAGIKIINTLREEYPELFDQDLEDKIIFEAKEAFSAESKIIDWMINGYNVPRLNASILKEYVKSRINDSLTQIGYNEIFDIDNDAKRDFEWMDEEIYGNSNVDFFFKRPTEYAKKHTCFDAEALFV